MDFANSHHQVLSAITTVLYVASAKLMLVFKAEGATDFIEITHRANRALGDEASPTDLALVLDQGLNHLLIDEFQDTSRRHMALLGEIDSQLGC
jgi:ATP-dependent exoDNAse (exonuclease V) beta subunit